MKLFAFDAAGEELFPVTLGSEIARGGAGSIHLTSTLPDEVAKIYHNTHGMDYEAKLNAMLNRQPKLKPISHAGVSVPQLTWPTTILKDNKGDFAGYTMPKLDFGNTVALESFLQRKMRSVKGLPEIYGYRVSLAYNLASVVAELHRLNHHIIDFKPMNCRVSRNIWSLTLLDCDGFSINLGGGRRFPAGQFTPEYIAPESGNDPAKLGEAQDLFALGVIVFRMLNNGLHPFQPGSVKNGSLKPIQEMINRGYYAYGGNSSYAPHPMSMFDFFPSELKGAFEKSFNSVSRTTANEWVGLLGDYADPSNSKLKECPNNPEHAKFTHICGMCRVEGRRRSPLKKNRQNKKTNLQKNKGASKSTRTFKQRMQSTVQATRGAAKQVLPAHQIARVFQQKTAKTPPAARVKPSQNPTSSYWLGWRLAAAIGFLIAAACLPSSSNPIEYRALLITFAATGVLWDFFARLVNELPGEEDQILLMSLPILVASTLTAAWACGRLGYSIAEWWSNYDIGAAMIGLVISVFLAVSKKGVAIAIAVLIWLGLLVQLANLILFAIIFLAAGFVYLVILYALPSENRGEAVLISIGAISFYAVEQVILSA